MKYDLIIVGGGIGGSSLGAIMAEAGWSVLVLEKQDEYIDRVRGEWIAPWGVAETQRVGLYDLLMSAGGHHITSHVTYDEGRAPADCEAETMPLGILPNVPGPLCIGHPHHCETLWQEASKRGADCRRPVNVLEVTLGDAPFVRWSENGNEHTAHAPLVVGAEGRQSLVRKQAAIHLHQDKPHHWFAGMLVDNVEGIDDTLQTIGTEGDFGFLAFPQGGTKVRVYGGYPIEDKKRFKGETGQQEFLDAFKFDCAPANLAIANGTPAGPLFSYFNNDSWTDEPFAAGTVLIGDAAGWNDPINGLGLSITYRDVRTVSEILKAGKPGDAFDFTPYATERYERMRRLRYAGHLQARLDMEFDDAAKARRISYHERKATDETLGMHSVAILAGPEVVPEEFFTDEHKARVLGET